MGLQALMPALSLKSRGMMESENVLQRTLSNMGIGRLVVHIAYGEQL